MLLFGFMWRKVCSWLFAVAFGVYMVALCGLVIHTWVSDSSAAPPMTKITTPPITFDTNFGTNSIRLIELTWKTAMTCSPTVKVNAEDIRVSHVSGY